MKNDSPNSDVISGSAAPGHRRTTGTLIPMKTLYERIEQVRETRQDLPAQLRNIAQEMPNSWTRKNLQKLADAVEQNVSAAEIVARFPEHCWLLTVQSSAATTDALTAMLEQSAYQNNLRTKKIRTIAYPLVLLVVATVMMLLTCVLLVPPFDVMYQEFGLRLPIQTAALIDLSRFVTGHPIIVVILVATCLIGLVGLLWIWIGDGVMKRKLLGSSTSQSFFRQSIAKVSMQVAELCDEGFPLDHALRIAAESNPNATLRSIIGDLAVQATDDPKKLQKTRAAMFLPPNFLFALNPAGAGSLVWNRAGDAAPSEVPNTTMLRELAASYRDLSIRRKDWTSFILGQITVIGVGLLIAFMVIALFAPMVSLVTNLSG